MAEIVARGKVGNLWDILALWRKLQPHIAVITDDSKPWRERLECGLHVAQIVAAETETGLDDDALAWLAEGGWDDVALDILAEILERLSEGKSPGIYGDAQEVEGISIVLLIQIAMFIWNIIKPFIEK